MPGIKNTMKEFGAGTLHSGSKTGPVRSRKQAIAIGLSEARKKGSAGPSPSAPPTPAAIPNTTPVAPTVRGEPVPGLMATRQALKGMRLDSLRHIKKSSR